MKGRTDIARLKSSATTMRNMFVRHTGGAFSRQGTAYVGFSKQTGRLFPPRLVTFQFNNDQGLALEFGNFYMRVIFEGALVTESALAITAATKANPCVITAPATGGQTATAVNSGVSSSYVPGEIVTLAGGSYSIPAQVTVNATTLLQIQPQAGYGYGYAPGDTVTLAGGVSSVAAVVTIATTRVNLAGVNAAGTGGTPGTATVTGTTGTGTKFQANVTIGGGGSITSVNYISVPGSYSVNPTTITAEPVTGGGLTGATLNLLLGPNTVTVTTGGTFSANPGGGVMSQASTSGSGATAAFFSALFGAGSCSVTTAGSYTSFPANPVAQASTTGSGSGIKFTITSASASAYNAGDWVYLSSIGGMTQLNGRTVVLGTPSGNNYPIYDVFGNAIDSTGYTTYTSGGTAARIYTLATPWAEQDLPYLKFAESTSTVSICCVNQNTQTEYPPYDLVRLNDAQWTLTQLSMGVDITPPGVCSLAITPTPGGASAYAHYQYVGTAVSAVDGKESQPSPIGDLPSGVDIAAYAGSITITVGAVSGAAYYNYYKALPGFSSSSANIPAPPVGSQFGYIGFSYGPQFVDTNITADFSQLPPTHQDPFARGVLLGAEPINVGTGYTHATATITTSTGSNGLIQCVIQNGQVVGYVASNPGANYAAADTVSISGDGSGATAALQVGPQTGTYPGVVSYYQSRRVYGSSLNNPNTYWMSATGAYTNFDVRNPPIDTDAITGTPWAQQVNGIQFFVSMPGGLVTLTGLAAWQVTGAGGSSFNPQPITPAGEIAQPQAYNGCSSIVPPIRINTDIIYVQAKGSLVRDLTYQFFTNIYTGTDLTIYSAHLFVNYTIREWAWAEEPYKINWAVRSDGVMLSLTYLREQEVWGWGRHDTLGLYQSVCSVTEPPVDAVYLAVQRTLNGYGAYFLERMDDRLWTDVESTWCVDCGLSLPQGFPSANISIDFPNGVGSLSGVTGLVGGIGYSASTTATVVDANGTGPGSGAVVSLTINGSGTITAVSFSSPGANYTYPQIVLNDPSGLGSGFAATVTLNTSATVNASVAIFSVGSVGSVIRAGGGLMQITAYIDTTHVTVSVLRPVIDLLPDAGFVALTYLAGTWSLTTPTSTVSGLFHLIGAYVVGIADGVAFGPVLVSAAGTITLPNGPASAVTVGLAFQAQMQTSNLDLGQPSTQGQRKKNAEVTIRANASLGIKAGANQQDGSMLNPMQIAPPWNDLDAVPDLVQPGYASPGYYPLWSGDQRIAIGSNWGKSGQIALQQDNPYPMEILSVIPEYLPGDTTDVQAKGRQQGRGQQ